MSLAGKYSLEGVDNLDVILANQKEKIGRLREMVRGLRFVPIDSGGSYDTITFKSFDGGMFNVSFDPFEFDIVEVADSNGNSKLKFAAPRGDMMGTEGLQRIISNLDENPVIRRFLGILGKDSLRDVSEILTNRGSLMEIGEFACIFDKAMSVPEDDQTIILRDGLLRTKKIKTELIGALRDMLEERKAHVKVIGVAKMSKIMFLLKTAMVCERTFPDDQIGYVKIPTEVEKMAYRWSGHGLINRDDASKPLDYAFGSLYIAKLARNSRALVTVEIPKHLGDGREMYTRDDIDGIMGRLAQDSAHSYPVIGYPQTIMKAHEYAASLGLPASILRDGIIKKMLDDAGDPVLAEYVRDAAMTEEGIDKGSLGGRA